MEEHARTGPETGEGSTGSGRDPFSNQSGATRDVAQWAATRQEGVPQRLETPWQEYLKTVQYPSSGWATSQLPDLASWDDVAAFDRVVNACQWPREGMSRLMPALSADAQQALSSLNARDKGDHGKAKPATLRGNPSSAETTALNLSEGQRTVSDARQRQLNKEARQPGNRRPRVLGKPFT
ncbi:UNVERIFIED_CONTAM: hypothetical protein K2H54_030278 [Gekko kuhli]